MVLCNSSRLSTLKFDDVVTVILIEEVHRKSIEEASSSGRALNMEEEKLLKEGKTIRGQNLGENLS